jgi:hypothetical protein
MLMQTRSARVPRRLQLYFVLVTYHNRVKELNKDRLVRRRGGEQHGTAYHIFRNTEII